MLRSYFSVRMLFLAVGLLLVGGTDRVQAQGDPSPPSASELGDDKGEPSTPEPAEEQDEEEKDPGVEVTYRNGLRLRSTDDKFSARIRWRAQLRGTTTSSNDLVGEEDGVEEAAGFRVRRARFKLDGHAYRPWIRYYLEYGIAGGFMLTYQFDLQPSEKIGVRMGQFKVEYNRERVDSSGAQQFADRSIVNSPFTIDRQTGPSLRGRLFAGRLADSRYSLGVFTGTGRGGGVDENRRPMYVGRWQWNFLKRDLPYSQSDIARREKPAASLAFAAASNVGEYTRFSSSGGGQLPGFESGASDRYKLTQWMGEFALHGRGLSLQGEYHWKRVEDREDDRTTEFDGWYAQAGYFPHEAFEGFPEPLELAVRLARVDSRVGVLLPADRELTFGGNWFFNGHNNKITVDASYLESTLPLGSDDSGLRFRVQWDVSF